MRRRFFKNRPEEGCPTAIRTAADCQFSLESCLFPDEAVSVGPYYSYNSVAVDFKNDSPVSLHRSLGRPTAAALSYMGLLRRLPEFRRLAVKPITRLFFLTLFLLNSAQRDYQIFKKKDIIYSTKVSLTLKFQGFKI